MGRVALLGLLLALGPHMVMAQTTAGATEEQNDVADSSASIISLTASIHADSMTISQRGRMKARVWANPGGEGQWKLDRGGLPNPIPVGKRFDNVTINLDAHAEFDDSGGVKVGGDAAAASDPGRIVIPAR